jgi:hypothetical protein
MPVRTLSYWRASTAHGVGIAEYGGTDFCHFIIIIIKVEENEMFRECSTNEGEEE